MIFGIIAGLVIIVLGIAIAINQEKLAWLLLSVVGFIVLLIGSSMKFVPTGYVGIRSAYGQIQDETATPGKVNYHIPLVESISLVKR